MAKKESFYFQHDYNARNDPKIQRLIMNCGVSGVGIYWCVVEMLYEQGGKLPIEDIEVIAYNLHIEKTTLEEVVFGLNLFVFDDTHFWSERALEVLEEREHFKTTQKQRALKGGAPKGNRNACKSIENTKSAGSQKQTKTTQNNPVVVFEQPENNPIIKGKEIKGDNNISPIPNGTGDSTPASEKGEKEKPPEGKKRYAEHVQMLEKEYDSLVKEFGQGDANRLVEILNNYKGANGKSYKSDYLAIRNWVVSRLQEEKRKNNGQRNSIQSARSPNEEASGGGYTSTI